MHRPAASALLALALALGHAPLAGAADEPPREARFHATLALDLDAEGRIVAIEPADARARELREFLLAEVSKWSFQPGTADGRAAPTSTSVVVALAAREAGEDYELRITGAGTGPRYDAATPPRYPTQAIRAREVGEVLVRVEIDAAGRPSAVDVHRSNASKRLESAALAAVRQWTFVPERVGGRAVPATVLAPVSFCLDRVCNPLPADEGLGEGDRPRLVGEPAARILDRGATG